MATPVEPTRTATPRGQAPTQNPGWLRTNQSLRGETLLRNDRVVDPLLWKWVKRIAIWGGAALLLWLPFGGFVAGWFFSPTESRIIERVIEIERPAPAPQQQMQPERSRSFWSNPANR